MAEPRQDDYLIDLGSGDGRIIIEAAKRGARAWAWTWIRAWSGPRPTTRARRA